MNSKDSKRIIYLTVSDLYNLNHTITEGDTFVRDVHLLESAAKRPSIVVFGAPQFPTIHDKAAALMHSVAYHHLFADGNKRTAIAAVAQFLVWNGWQATWDDDAAQAFVLGVAQKRYELEQIAAWIAQHSKPLELDGE